MQPSDDELSDEQLRADLLAELDAVLPPAPRWETLPWHVRPPWPRRIQWARRAALATGLLLGAGLIQREWLADDPTEPTDHTAEPTDRTTNAPPEPVRQAAPPPANPPEPATSPQPSPKAPAARPEPPQPAPDGDALVAAEPEPESPREWTRGSGEAPIAIAFAVRIMRDGQCQRLESTQIQPGQSLCFQLSVRPAATVAVMVEAPGGTSELTRLQGGPARVLVSSASGASLTFQPSAAGRYRFYAVVPGEVCGPDCHSVTLDFAP